MRIIYKYTFLFQYSQRHFLLFVGCFTAKKSNFSRMVDSKNLNSKLFSNIITKNTPYFHRTENGICGKKYFMTKFKDCRFHFFL